MPLAFASSMGGMMTLIGTPPNACDTEHINFGKDSNRFLSSFFFCLLALFKDCPVHWY